MRFQIVKGVVACTQSGVLVDRCAISLPEDELKRAITVAHKVIEDPLVLEDHCSGSGVFVTKFYWTYEEYLETRRRKVERQERAPKMASPRQRKAIRDEFVRNRKRLKRAMLESGLSFECASCKAADDVCIDHIIPVSHGGTNDMKNLQFLCRRCNGIKSNYILDEVVA